MNYFLSFRTASVGGAVASPRLLQGDAAITPLALTVVPDALVPSIVNGKNILFGAHGFNVSLQKGTHQLGGLDDYLQLGPSLFIGVLWPGDSWIPIIDYPVEGNVAVHCGQLLANFCNTVCANAQSISFMSHSLGGRLVLEAISHMKQKARIVCLTAGAVNRDCLVTQYASATTNTDQISILASHKDLVLAVAFTIGDPIANLLHPDHSPFHAALGYNGPPPPTPAEVRAPWQIADDEGYTHGSYMPSGPPVDPSTGRPAKWTKVAGFIKRAFLGQPQTWPGF